MNEDKLSDTEMFVSDGFDQLIDLESLTKDESKYETYVKELNDFKRLKKRTIGIKTKEELTCVGILNYVKTAFDNKLKLDFNITACSDKFVSTILLKQTSLSSIQLSERSDGVVLEQSMFEMVPESKFYKITHINLSEKLDENDVYQTSLEIMLELVS